jgi:hypothetical protein
MARPRVMGARSEPVGVPTRSAAASAWPGLLAGFKVGAHRLFRPPPVSEGYFSRSSRPAMSWRACQRKSGTLPVVSTFTAPRCRRRGEDNCTAAARANPSVSCEVVARGLDDRAVVPSGEALALEPRPGPVASVVLPFDHVESVRAEGCRIFEDLPATVVGVVVRARRLDRLFRIAACRQAAARGSSRGRGRPSLCCEPDALLSILRHSRHRPCCVWGCSVGCPAPACPAASDHYQSRAPVCRFVANGCMSRSPFSPSRQEWKARTVYPCKGLQLTGCLPGNSALRSRG